MEQQKQFDSNMRGGLYPNANKAKDSAPDYKGQCEIDGKKYWVASWVKEGRGSNFQSLSFEPFSDEDYKKSEQIAKSKVVTSQPVSQGLKAKPTETPVLRKELVEESDAILSVFTEEQLEALRVSMAKLGMQPAPIGSKPTVAEHNPGHIQLQGNEPLKLDEDDDIPF